MIRALALELARTRSGRTPYPCCVDIHCSDEAIVLSGDLATTRAADDSSHVVGNTARAEEIALAGFFLASDASTFVTGPPPFADSGIIIKK